MPFLPIFWKFRKTRYICNVFFIVLDLRLTKRLAVWEDSLFFGTTSQTYSYLCIRKK